MRKDLTRLSMLTAAGLVVAWLEYLLVPDIAVPGVKLGLANVATLLALYFYCPKGAAGVLVSRVLLSNFLFGSLSAVVYALSGGFLALLVMALLRMTRKFTPVGVSAAGGLSHNMGQLLAAAAVARTPGLMYYLPTLAVAGVLTGAAVGFLASAILKKVG